MKEWLNELVRLVKVIIKDVKALILFIVTTKKQVSEAVDEIEGGLKK